MSLRITVKVSMAQFYIFFPSNNNVPQHLFSQILASIFNVVLIQGQCLFQNHYFLRSLTTITIPYIDLARAKSEKLLIIFIVGSNKI